MKELETNRYATNRLCNMILHPDMTSKENRDSNVELFLNYLKTPRDLEDVRKEVSNLLKVECARAVDEAEMQNIPKKIFVNKEKKVVTILWPNGKTTTSKCYGDDEFDVRVGIALCFTRYYFGESKTSLKRNVDNNSFFNENDIVYVEPKKKKQTEEKSVHDKNTSVLKASKEAKKRASQAKEQLAKAKENE